MMELFRINKHTGKPVGAELENLLENCRHGNVPDIHAMRSTPEVRAIFAEQQKIYSEVESRLSKVEPGYEPFETMNDDSPERMEIRRKIYQRLSQRGGILRNKEKNQIWVTDKLDLYGHPVLRNGKPVEEYSYIAKPAQERCLDLVIGLPGLGKNDLVKNISADCSSRVLDFHWAEELLPEYHHGLGATAVFNEALLITFAVYKKALEQGDNIVFSVVSGSVVNIDEIINWAHDANYEVRVEFAQLNAGIFTDYVFKDYFDGGDYFSLDVIDLCTRNGIDQCLETYNKLKQSPGICGYARCLMQD